MEREVPPAPISESESGSEGREVQFVISHTQRETVRRLQRVRGCWHARELAFRYFQEARASEPPLDSFTVLCRDC